MRVPILLNLLYEVGKNDKNIILAKHFIVLLQRYFYNFQYTGAFISDCIYHVTFKRTWPLVCLHMKRILSICMQCFMDFIT